MHLPNKDHSDFWFLTSGLLYFTGRHTENRTLMNVEKSSLRLLTNESKNMVEKTTENNCLTEFDKTVNIHNMILYIRGRQVMLDKDLAEIYGIELKRLNEQVKRNIDRFPDNFRFQLTKDENLILRSQIATLKIELVTNCDRLIKLKYNTANPSVILNEIPTESESK